VRVSVHGAEAGVVTAREVSVKQRME